MVNTELTFNTHGGTEIAATFTAPSGRGVFPAVLLCQGLSGVRHLVLPRIAEGLAERGFASLRFDYAGHGESGGPRGLIDPFARVVDGRYALATLLTLGEVDSDRVGGLARPVRRQLPQVGPDTTPDVQDRTPPPPFRRRRPPNDVAVLGVERHPRRSKAALLYALVRERRHKPGFGCLQGRRAHDQAARPARSPSVTG